MTLPAYKEPLFGPQAYLDWEAQQQEKHEYLDGEVLAMAGASEAHVTITGNVFIALRSHLRGSPCSVFISDMKLRVESVNAYFYPDVFVTCAPSDKAQPLVKTAPSLIVEVLSPTTQAYDRDEKFAAYRSLPSLREYLIIDSTRRRAELFRRNAKPGAQNPAGHWSFFPLDGEQTLELASVDLQLPLAAVYEDVSWPNPPVSSPASSPAPMTASSMDSGV